MVKFTVRLPDDMHERIKNAAKEDTRSLNGQVVHLLDVALVQHESAQRAVEGARRGFRIEHGTEGGR